MQQLEFEASQEDYRVVPIDPAVPPKAPTNNKRIKYMAAAPIAAVIHGSWLVLLAGSQGRTGWLTLTYFQPESGLRSMPCLLCQRLEQFVN